MLAVYDSSLLKSKKLWSILIATDMWSNQQSAFLYTRDSWQEFCDVPVEHTIR